MESKYNYDIIRDYLHGVVDAETARKIRELIRTDEVARNIAAGILQLEHEFNGDEKEIEAYIEQLREKQLSIINSKTRISRTWMRLAAAILVIAIAAPVLWLTVFRSESILEKELSEPYPLAAVERGASANKAFELYINGEYEEAFKTFGDARDATSLFYQGMSALYAGRYESAASILASEKLSSSRYKEQAEWFRSLALLKLNRKPDAIALLKKISEDPSHYKSATALALLKDLE